MEFVVKKIENITEKEKIASEILLDLPEWFGLPDSTQEYIEDSKKEPFIAAYCEDTPIGFIVLHETSEDCVEVLVIGVKKKYHHQGVGRLLNIAFETLAKEKGYTYSQVKTVETGHYKEYDITNAFYASMGYKKLEVFPTLWDAWNPCQIYIKYLGK